MPSPTLGSPGRRLAAFVMASALPATAPSRSARRGERKTIGVEEIEAGVERLRFLNELLLLRGQGRRGAADATGGPGRPSEGNQRLRRVPVDLTRPRICSQGSTCPGTQRLIWRARRNYALSQLSAVLRPFPAGRQRPSRVEDALAKPPRNGGYLRKADGCNRQSQGRNAIVALQLMAARVQE
jgi:hypothetical protein